MSFIGVAYRSRNDPEIAASPKPTSAWVAFHKTWKPGAHCTSCRLVNRLKNVLSKRLSWSKPLSGSVGLVLESSLLLVLSESLVFVAFIAYSVRAYRIWYLSGTGAAVLSFLV